jgi:uncharacterized Fe-S center protein
MAEKAKVYFADFRCPSWRENLPQKLARLMMTAGFGDIDMEDKFVAIKMHFGEPGNLAYLRPNWAKVVVDLVKSQGGKPFLTDCNTLYVGGRRNPWTHRVAYVNGFTPYSTGCHVIIADGLKGNDEVEVPVDGGEYVKTAKIGRAVMDADVFVSLTHFKGHEQAGMGGTLKNIGMGCGSRAGKMEQHNSGKPFVKQKKCIGCRACAKICAHGAPEFGPDGKAAINTDKCVGCALVSGRVPKDAIAVAVRRAPAILNKKIASTPGRDDGAPASTCRWWWTCPPTATATGRTTCPSSPTWACSPPSIPWRWTRPVPTRSWPRRRSATPPSLTRTAAAPTRTSSTPSTRTLSGRCAWSTRRSWVWAPGSMNW